MRLFLLVCVAGWAAAQPKCAALLDLVLIIDGSTSISSSDWKQDQQFFLDLADEFQLGPNATHIGAVQFASSVQIEFNCSGNATLVVSSLKNMAQLGGGTPMAAGLQLGQQVLDASGRSEAKQLAFLVTDGVPNGPDPVPVASKIKSSGVELFAIGVGSGINKALLQEIASPSLFFAVSDWSAISDILNSLALKSCLELDSVAPDHGPSAGGTAVVISGKHFDLFEGGKIYVKFGDQVVSGVYGDASSIGAVTPAATLAGPVKIAVSADGNNWVESNVTFDYESGGGGGSCPNNCSNHGSCLAGKCLCNKGYGGPDCSEQSCNPACANGKCVNGSCQCSEGFQGPQCQYPIIVCCQYCSIYSTGPVAAMSDCQQWQPGGLGPDGSPCKGNSDYKFKKWWVQGSQSNGNCTDVYQCIFESGIWTYPRACTTGYGYCN